MRSVNVSEHIREESDLNRRAKLTVLVGAVVVVAGAGLFSWWNTDVLGQDDFCRGAVSSAEMSAVLDGTGRLTQDLDYESDDPYGLHCTVRRTSKFVGASQPTADIELTAETAVFPFQSRRWKNPSDMSYLTDGATGAVSETKGWVLLPQNCWDPLSTPKTRNTVPVVEVSTSKATSRPAMARLALRAAEHVMSSVGCSQQNSPEAPPRLQGPEGSRQPHQTDPQKVCDLDGFSLPESTFGKGAVGLGTERATAAGSPTWACDLYLKGPELPKQGLQDAERPQITFAVSQDPNVVNGVLRDQDAKDLRRMRGGSILKCRQGGDIYVGMNLNDAYGSSLDEQGEPTSERTRGELLSSFVEAVSAERGCDPAA